MRDWARTFRDHVVQSLCSKPSHLHQVLADDVQLHFKRLQAQKLHRVSQQHVCVLSLLRYLHILITTL